MSASSARTKSNRTAEDDDMAASVAACIAAAAGNPGPYTPEMAARLINDAVAPQTLVRMAYRRRIGFVKVGRSICFMASDLANYLADRRRPPLSAA